ncbi:hypothetical protein TSMEX_006367 [Taenia solium]|eukprot:TsM_000644200 transcript=TsM_000644200 gene=TsM_000644200
MPPFQHLDFSNALSPRMRWRKRLLLRKKDTLLFSFNISSCLGFGSVQLRI